MTSIAKKKSTLIEKGKYFKDSIREDIKHVKENSKEILSNGLIVVGIFGAGLILYKLLTMGGDHEESNASDGKVMVIKSESSNTLFNSIMNSIAIFLLNVAKDKLMQFLDKKASAQVKESK